LSCRKWLPEVAGIDVAKDAASSIVSTFQECEIQYEVGVVA